MPSLEESETACKIELAISNVLKRGKVLTPDLGGKSNTIQMTNEIIKELNGGI